MYIQYVFIQTYIYIYTYVHTSTVKTYKVVETVILRVNSFPVCTALVSPKFRSKTKYCKNMCTYVCKCMRYIPKYI